MTINDPSAGIPPGFNPYLALISGVLAVSTGAIFARLADAPSLVIAAYRVGLAAVVLIPIAWWKGKDELLALSNRNLKLAALSGLFLALHFTTWIASLNYTSVANSVVLVNTNPVWVALLAPLFTKDHMSRSVFASIAVCVAGGILIGYGDFSTDPGAWRGDLLALAGSLFGTFYLIIGRNIRERISLLAYITVCYCIAASILLVLVMILKLPLIGYSNGTVAAFFGLAMISQLVGHSSYNWALKWISTSTIAVSLLGEPLLCTIMAYLLFHEGLSGLKILGGVLILTGIYSAARFAKDLDLTDEGAL